VSCREDAAGDAHRSPSRRPPGTAPRPEASCWLVWARPRFRPRFRTAVLGSLAVAGFAIAGAPLCVLLRRDGEVDGLSLDRESVQFPEKRHAPLAPRARAKTLRDLAGDNRLLACKEVRDLPKRDPEAEADLVVGIHEGRIVIGRVRGRTGGGRLALGVQSGLGSAERLRKAPPICRPGPGFGCGIVPNSAAVRRTEVR